MTLESFGHDLAFVLRFDDYFTSEPVADELPLRLGGSLRRPVQAADGGYRHSDGTYRFIDLETGVHEVKWSPPLTGGTDQWVSWQPRLSVTVPQIQPSSIIVRELWPTPAATVPASATAIRGKLVGASVADRRVVIEATAAPPRERFTRTNSSGEFLFVVNQTATISGAGLVALVVSVDGGAVTGGQVEGVPFAGPNFEIIPSRASRVTFIIT